MNACRDSGYQNIFGVDYNVAAVEYATKTIGLKNVRFGDAFAYLEGQLDNSFDVITAVNFVEHIKKEHVLRLFSLVSKTQKRG